MKDHDNGSVKCGSNGIMVPHEHSMLLAELPGESAALGALRAFVGPWSVTADEPATAD